MKINIILPYFSKRPGGGLKVMYQYANQLNENGHDVVVYHSSRTRWTQRPQKYFLYLASSFRHLVRSAPASKRPSWFDLSPEIESVEVPKIKNRYIRDADIIFSTWWATAIEISLLDPSKGAKHNLIQDYEAVMTKRTELVHQSYQTPIAHIVIATYLQPLIEKYSGKKPPVIPNAISHDQFFVEKPVRDRDRKKIMMFYSRGARKGSKYGLQSLQKVAEAFPDIEVIFFCAENIPPNNLNFKFSFYHQPDNLRELFNSASIFITPSLHEGWGLPAMEAMACGCACVCTNVEGHLDFMTNEKTALLVAPARPDEMADAIIQLIKNDELRINLALAAEKNIQSFSWQNSTRLLEQEFQKSLQTIYTS